MNEDAVKKWIARAESDLKIAKDEIQTPEPVTDLSLNLYLRSLE